jgi:transposase-like protein
MARKRKARGKELKARVALAALSGQSPSRIASRFGVHPTQVAGKEEQVAPVRSPDSDKSKEASPSPSKWFLARIDFAQRVVCARSVSKAADS